MSLGYKDEESQDSQRALADARLAVARGVARSQENKELVEAMARDVGLENVPTAVPSKALDRAVSAQLEVVEEIGAKVKAAGSPSEAQEWQTVQRNAFQDLRGAEEAAREHQERQLQAAQEHRERQLQAVHNRAMDRITLLGGVSFGVLTVAAGAVLCIGHPLIGAPIVGIGGTLIKQALSKPGDRKKASK